jgi:DAACS family dicarboxylate/amino acid:cation (Na+ or H+) symporter
MLLALAEKVIQCSIAAPYPFTAPCSVPDTLGSTMRKQAAVHLLLALTIGAVLGLGANALAAQAQWLELSIRYVADPIGKVFIRALLMLVIPIMFSALVMGISELELSQLGRLGVRTLGYHGASLDDRGAARSSIGERAKARHSACPKPCSIRHDRPSRRPRSRKVRPPSTFWSRSSRANPVAAAATGDMLAWLFFSLFFGSDSP